MGSEDQIYLTVALFNLLHHLLLLHHAAAERNHHLRALPLIRPQLTQTAIYPKVGIFPYRTGIIKNKVGILGAFLPVPHLLQYAHQLFRVPCIHLAAEGLNMEGHNLPAVGFL